MNIQAMRDEIADVSYCQRILEANQKMIKAIEDNKVEKMEFLAITSEIGNFNTLLEGDFSVLVPLIRAENERLHEQIKAGKERMKALLQEDEEIIESSLNIEVTE